MKERLDICKKVVEHCSNINDISTRKRITNYVLARAIFYHLAVDKLKCSKIATGRHLKRDHASVFYSLNKLDVYKRGYPDFNKLLIECFDYYHQLTGIDLRGKKYIEYKDRLSILENEISHLRAQGKISNEAFELIKDPSYKELLKLPKEKIEEFKNFRLIPFLKMHRN